jgi:enoyl-CoA hydratase/carnithine racemase
MSLLNNHCEVTVDAPGVLRLTIVNAGKANVLGTPVIAALLAGLTELAQDATLRALVLTGMGERTFIGGADIAEMAKLERGSAEAFISGLRDLCEAVRAFPVPVLCRIPGWCLGGGLELAMACDLRVASTTAQFAMPEVKVGIPSVIHAALMPRLIGSGRARWMSLTGVTIDAATALTWGLVDRIIEPEALDEAIATSLAQIVACGPEVIRAQKVLLKQWEDLPLQDAIASSVSAFGRAFETGEPQRFMQPFLDRRAAKARPS